MACNCHSETLQLSNMSSQRCTDHVPWHEPLAAQSICVWICQGLLRLICQLLQKQQQEESQPTHLSAGKSCCCWWGGMRAAEQVRGRGMTWLLHLSVTSFLLTGV
jgi:hypothetical protein